MKHQNFKDKVLALVANLPCGQTSTYKRIAVLAGRPRAYRAVGNILSRNFDKNIPCHRVIRSDGQLGGYNRGRDRKARKLKAESFK